MVLLKVVIHYYTLLLDSYLDTTLIRLFTKYNYLYNESNIAKM